MLGPKGIGSSAPKNAGPFDQEDDDWYQDLTPTNQQAEDNLMVQINLTTEPDVRKDSGASNKNAKETVIQRALNKLRKGVVKIRYGTLVSPCMIYCLFVFFLFFFHCLRISFYLLKKRTN